MPIGAHGLVESFMFTTLTGGGINFPLWAPKSVAKNPTKVQSGF